MTHDIFSTHLHGCAAGPNVQVTKTTTPYMQD